MHKPYKETTYAEKPKKARKNTKKTKYVDLDAMKHIFNERFKIILTDIRLMDEEKSRQEKMQEEEELRRAKALAEHTKLLKYQEKLRKREERKRQKQLEEDTLNQKPTDLVDLFFWNEKPKYENKRKIIY